MGKNSNLHSAKVAKNDDFFTQLCDIENELRHYWSHGVNHFEGKSVLCNCDNPDFSNFWAYFHKRFKQLGLKSLTAIHYSVTEPAYVKVYNGGDDFDISVGEVTYLNGNGDFRSEECINILKGVDMVVTNPPFSLYREFVAQLVKYNKQFILWANNNSITYKEIFHLIKDSKMWLGNTCNKACVFALGDDYAKWDEKETYKRNDGHKYGKVPAISTFTNIDLQRRHDWMVLSKAYTPEAYPKYDNYDAINVDKISDIPVDYFESYIVPLKYKDNLKGYHIYDDIMEFWDAVKYKELPSDKIAIEHNGNLIVPVYNENTYTDLLGCNIYLGDIVYRNGIMGVPITYLGRHNPEQLSIIGLDRYTAPKEVLTGGRLTIDGKIIYARILLKCVLVRKNKDSERLANKISRLLNATDALKHVVDEFNKVVQYDD